MDLATSDHVEDSFINCLVFPEYHRPASCHAREICHIEMLSCFNFQNDFKI